MTNAMRLIPHLAAVVVLMALALCLPLPLYLVSLALFGLPHIVWELGFLRSRYAERWPAHWWLTLWAVLFLQAAVRGSAWLGMYSAESSRIVDLLALFLLGLILVFAPMRAGWLVRVAGLALAAVVMWLLQRGDVVAALLFLAIGHNFTPLVMAWDMARNYRPAYGLACAITGLLLLPVLVAASGWEGGKMPATFASHAWALDGQLPATPGAAQRQALLSAFVLAQCLHYYCVIVLLPQAEAQRTGMTTIPLPVRRIVLLALLALLAYYLYDFNGARQLYAVAAGAHAWLEWPVLLMALLGISGKPEALRTRDYGH